MGVLGPRLGGSWAMIEIFGAMNRGFGAKIWGAVAKIEATLVNRGLYGKNWEHWGQNRGI